MGELTCLNSGDLEPSESKILYEIKIEGCGAKYDEVYNQIDSCLFHKGAPIFHEGWKEWSCCHKKDTDFETFVKLPGCTTGKHSIEKKKTTPAPSVSEKVQNSAVQNLTSNPISQSSFTPTSQQPSKPKLKEIDKHDDAEAVISLGSRCLRPGCSGKYENLESKKEECVFHSSLPVFHEGDKSWPCCKKSSGEFEQFMKLKGCSVDKHRFVPTEDECASTDLRKDWYQTLNTIEISVFVRNVVVEETVIDISSNQMNLTITYGNPRKVSIMSSTFLEEIDPKCSSYQILNTKIEITLKKLKPISWPVLESGMKFTTATTFGIQNVAKGTTGTAMPYIAADSPYVK